MIGAVLGIPSTKHSGPPNRSNVYQVAVHDPKSTKLFIGSMILLLRNKETHRRDTAQKLRALVLPEPWV